MKFIISILGSGSKGNSIYIETDRVSLLIDAGFSAREIERRLSTNGFDIARLRALLVTHEHTDHVKGLGPLYRKYGVEVFSTSGSIPKKEANKITDFNKVIPGKLFQIENLRILPFAIPHDATNPVGYRLEVGEKSVVVATDFGHPTPLIKERMKEADLIIVEANHNEKMLWNGKYSWELKQRIRSNVGHISNKECGNLLLEVLSKKTKRVYLSHISEENNTYKKAFTEVATSLLQRFSKDKISSFLKVAEQNKVTVPYEL
jgi:phosphoribosyl 1,2-cyclic phosphodiesterase